MIGRIVEIQTDGRHLSLFRGFLRIEAKGDHWKEIGRIPLDDIVAVVSNAHGITYTNNIMVELARRGIPFVLTSDDHEPVGVLWSVSSNSTQSKRIEAQIQASLPLKKNIWAEIVRAKIRSQAQGLEYFGKKSNYLIRLIKDVTSGDTTNREAVAAKYYFRELFGSQFVRDRKELGINARLNYGYTILRTAVTQAVLASGLHPSVGLHHKNEFNSFRLVDDLIEPFRVLVDVKVKTLCDGYSPYAELENGVTADEKAALVGVLHTPVLLKDGTATPAVVAIQSLSVSIAQKFIDKEAELILPDKFIYEETIKGLF